MMMMKNSPSIIYWIRFYFPVILARKKLCDMAILLIPWDFPILSIINFSLYQRRIHFHFFYDRQADRQKKKNEVFLRKLEENFSIKQSHELSQFNSPSIHPHTYCFRLVQHIFQIGSNMSFLHMWLLLPSCKLHGDKKWLKIRVLHFSFHNSYTVMFYSFNKYIYLKLLLCC